MIIDNSVKEVNADIQVFSLDEGSIVYEYSTTIKFKEDDVNLDVVFTALETDIESRMTDCVLAEQDSPDNADEHFKNYMALKLIADTVESRDVYVTFKSRIIDDNIVYSVDIQKDIRNY